MLETALENVVSKYSRHLEIIKPALEMLLQQVSIFPQSISPCQQKVSNLLFQVEANPETNGLRRLLAVKKSLAEFEQNVELVSKVSLFLFHYSSSSRSTLNAEAYVVTSGEMLFLDIQDLFGIGSLFSVSEKNTLDLHLWLTKKIIVLTWFFWSHFVAILQRLAFFIIYQESSNQTLMKCY